MAPLARKKRHDEGEGEGGGKRTRWRVFNDNFSYLVAAHAVQSCVPPLLVSAGKSTDLRRPQIGSRALAGQLASLRRRPGLFPRSLQDGSIPETSDYYIVLSVGTRDCVDRE